MATSQKIKIPAALSVSVEGLSQATEEIQKNVNSIQFNSNRDLKDFQERLFVIRETLKALGEKIELGEVDARQLKEMEDEISDITKGVNTLAKKTNSGIAVKGLRKDVKVLEAFNAAMKDASGTVGKMGKSFSAVERELKKQQEIINASKTNVNDLTKAQQENQANLDKALEKFNTKYRQNRGHGSDPTKDDVKELEALHEKGKAPKYYEEFRKAAEQAFPALDELKTKIVDNESTLATAQGKLQELQSEYNNLSQVVLSKVVTALQSFAKEAGVALDDFGISSEDLSSLNQLNNSILQLQNRTQDAADKGIADTNNALRNMSGLADQAKGAINETGASLDDLTRRSNDIQRLRNTLINFFSISNQVNIFKRSIRDAYSSVKELDAIMTETAVVTDYTIGDMWQQIGDYTKRANELGVAIQDTYKAATLYYQQGLQTSEVTALSNETLKMARIASLDSAEATDRMTNALRGFNMELNETSARNVNDVYSQLAAITASDVDEISTAMTKVASLANNANMSFENTSAFLSQIIETTRESAETAGTALKTVIARFSEVKQLYTEGQLTGTDEEGEVIDVNRIQKALRTAGIDMSQFLLGKEGLDQVFMRLSEKWDSLTTIQQRYIATQAAGSRQQSRFIALMQDYERMQYLTQEATNANGASQRQFEKTLDSLQSKLARLKNEWTTFTTGLANNEIIKTVVDLLTNLLGAFNKLTEGTNGVSKALLNTVAFVGMFAAGNKLLHGTLNTLIKDNSGLANFLGITASKASAATGVFGRLTTGFKEYITAAGTGTTLVHSLGNAFEGFGGQLKKTIKTVALAGGKILFITAAIGAVIGAITLVVKAIKDARHHEEDAYKQIKKHSDELKDKNSEVVNSYNELNSSIEALKEQQKTIEGLRVGTDEWREAVNKNNASVRELVSQYKDLAEAVGIDKNGVVYLRFDSDPYAEFQERQAHKARVSSIAANISDQEVTRQERASLVEQARNATSRSISEAQINELASALRNGRIVNGNLTYDAGTIIQDVLQTDKFSEVVQDNIDLFEKIEDATEGLVKKLEGFNTLTASEITKGLDLSDEVKTATTKLISDSLGNTGELIVSELTEGANWLETLQKYDAIIEAEGYKKTNVSGKYTKDDKTYSINEIAEEIAAAVIDNQQQVSAKAIGEILTEDVQALRILTNGGQVNEESAANSLWGKYEKEFTAAGLNEEKFNDYIDGLRLVLQEQVKVLKELYPGRNNFTNGELGTFTSDELSLMSGIVKDIFVRSGKEDFVEATTDSIIEMLSGIDDHSIRETFLSLLSGIDFSTQSGIREFSDRLKDLQVDGKWTNEQLEDFERNLIIWADSLNSVNWDAAINGISELLQVLQGADSKEILSFSEDLKGFLTSMGLATEDQFIQNIDGNYDFTGSWQELFDALQSGDFYSNSEDAKKVRYGEALQRSNFNTEATTEAEKRAALWQAAKTLDDDYIRSLVEDAEYNGLSQEAIDEYNKLSELVTGLDDNQQALIDHTTALEQFIGQIADPHALMNSSDNWNALYSQSRHYGVDQNAATGTNGDVGALGTIVNAFKQLSDFGIDTDGLDSLAKATGELFELDPAKAYALAASTIELNTGLSNLADNYEDINTILSSSNTASIEYNEKLDETLRMLEQIGMVSKGSLTGDFFEQNTNALDLMKAAANNDRQALQDLQKEIWTFTQNKIIAELDIKDDNLRTKLSNVLNEVQNGLNENDITVGLGLNSFSFIQGLINTFKEANKITDSWTAEQIKAFENLADACGMEVQWSTRTEPIFEERDVWDLNLDDSMNTSNMTATKRRQKVQVGRVTVPVPQLISKGNNPAGSNGFNFSSSIDPTTAQKLNDNANKNTSEKNPTWKNPYDELYNLNEEINEQLRQREKIERDYDRLIKRRMATTKDLKKDSMDTIASLRREVDLQRQLQEGRLRQINNIGQMDYIDSEGNLTNFAATGATKYAYYANGEIHIDWEGLQAVQARGDDKLGSAIEAYISQMEEWVQDYEKTEETIEDMEDEIYEISQRGMKEYLELEERVYDALVQQEQKIIDDYNELSQTIDEANSKIIDSLNEQINLERQIRDNTKQEEDIADMQRRLAYLRMDTSGANALEIASLENQIQEAQESYTDRLIDQAVQKLQDDNQKASEQREQQIAMMQAELEWRASQGDFWPRTYQLLEAAFADNGHFDVNSDLASLLEETDAFNGMSYFGKENWLIDMAETFAEAMQGQENWWMESAKRHGTVNVNGQQLTWDGKNWVDSNGKTYNVGYDKDKGGYYIGASGSTGTTAPSTPTPTPAQPTQPTTPPTQNKAPDETAHKGVALAIAQGVGGWYNGSWQVGHQLYNELVSRHFNFDKVRSYVNQFAPQLKNSNAIIKQLLGIDPKTLGALYGISNFPAYKQGGLASKTGLAWLDGTFSKPEAVLNPEQTANFVRLRDILDKFMQNNRGSGDIGNSYFDININVDQIANDYDVQRLAAKIKQEIQSDSMYRNVNSLGRLR